MTSVTPRCWKCGYDLRGLRVEDACPECATPVWSLRELGPDGRPDEVMSTLGQTARHWGVISVGLLLITGPVAAFAAVPAIRYARRAKMLAKSGYIPERELTDAWIGLVCGLFTIGVLCAVVVLLACAALM